QPWASILRCLHCIVYDSSIVSHPLSRDGYLTGRAGMTTSEQMTSASLLDATAQRIDRLIAAIGAAVMWLSLLLVLLQFAVVLLRYAFELGSIWLGEWVIYCQAALFMLAGGWTLQQNGHVRLDFFYGDASARRKAVVDLAGALLLLLPFVVAVLWFSV